MLKTNEIQGFVDRRGFDFDKLDPADVVYTIDRWSERRQVGVQIRAWRVGLADDRFLGDKVLVYLVHIIRWFGSPHWADDDVQNVVETWRTLADQDGDADAADALDDMTARWTKFLGLADD